MGVFPLQLCYTSQRARANDTVRAGREEHYEHCVSDALYLANTLSLHFCWASKLEQHKPSASQACTERAQPSPHVKSTCPLLRLHISYLPAGRAAKVTPWCFGWKIATSWGLSRLRKRWKVCTVRKRKRQFMQYHYKPQIRLWVYDLNTGTENDAGWPQFPTQLPTTCYALPCHFSIHPIPCMKSKTTKCWMQSSEVAQSSSTFSSFEDQGVKCNIRQQSCIWLHAYPLCKKTCEHRGICTCRIRLLQILLSSEGSSSFGDRCWFCQSLAL